MSSDVGLPAFIVRVCASDFEFFNQSKWILVVNILIQILLNILLPIDYSSRCKLKVCNSHQRETLYDKLMFFAKLVRQWESKEWAKFELECLLLIFIYSNSKFKATCKNADFEFWYIRTLTKEKPSKISDIAFAILPFIRENTQTEWPSWVLWNPLLLMNLSDALQNGSFQYKKRKIYSWMIPSV